jgi:diguanylate cyclase (GGDEF)-like protein
MHKQLQEFTSSLTLLYVEDDTTFQSVTLDLLKCFFNKILVANDGKEGYKLFIDSQVDIIITDIRMPIMDGTTMIGRIRENNKKVPIVILSAYDQTDYFLDAIQYDVSGYMMKPLSQTSFLQILLKIQNHLKEETLKSEKIAKLKKMETELYLRHYHDDTTGLQNRFALEKNLHTYYNPQIMLIDINCFSDINNTYWTEVGDQVLKEVARRLDSHNHQGCSLYYLASDQFILLKHTVEQKNCDKAALNVLEIISNTPIKIKTKDLDIKLNISATCSIAQSTQTDKLLLYADMAIKYAKKTHQPYVIYSESLRLEEKHLKTINAINLIKSAIEEDAIVPFFQPIIKKQSISYECLVRLEHEGKIISPFLFLEEIKHTSYYSHLTKTIIDKSFAFFEHRSNCFSINLSFEDVVNSDLVEYIRSKIIQYSLQNRLIIEIVESESIDNFNIIKSFISQMKNIGVQIAIDDFGSGYSNFIYLLELQPDFIKIDGSLIKNIDTDPKSFAIVKSIVNFAQELDIKVIAEFVHNENVYTKAKELDIYGFQGYHLGEPKNNILENVIVS